VTIAVCYVTQEGVVLGADSTASATLPGGFHYFNFNQKVFEIGESGRGTLGIATWGLGAVGDVSHRTLLAQLGDQLRAQPPTNVLQAATRWADHVWAAYEPLTKRCLDLNAKAPFDPNDSTNPAARTKTEEEEFQILKRGLVLGFFLGGYLPPQRVPEAYVIAFDPLQGKPSPAKIVGCSFSGAPNMIARLLSGCDADFKAEILNSGKWSGAPGELDAMLAKYQLALPFLPPIRDAIDFVHGCIASTIKALKFSSMPQICGGPIEIAVITTDRQFRWVKHKEWDAAINEGT
jgi:hypothetical protein